MKGRSVTAIRVEGLVKRFRVREGVPTGWGFGDAHWMISMLFRARSVLREFTAVNGVDLAVERGELFGLLGPNGAGKTTLIKCLATLLTPEAGTARINGYDLRRETEQVKLSVNLIGSGHWIGFDWGLTVRENLEFFGYLYGLDRATVRARIEEAVSLMGLADKLRAVPHHLSSGERQKVLLAKGFLVRTPVFFLDEPTVGLDPVSARDVRRYVQQTLSAELGVTILLTTHYMQEAEALCRRVAIMDRGRVIACDTPEALKRGLQQQEVLEVAAPELPGAVREALHALPAVQGIGEQLAGDGEAGCQLRILTDDADRAAAQVADLFRREGVPVTEISPAEVTLEDVFLALTGRELA
jgi:ABC-2 type transport system ATP-binding protein